MQRLSRPVVCAGKPLSRLPIFSQQHVAKLLVGGREAILTSLTPCDALIPGSSANRFDALLSIADFPSRHNAVTFIDYLNIGENIVTSPSRNLVVKSLDDLCGRQVALLRGTATMEEANKVSAKCVANGKAPLVVATYPDTNMTLLSLTTNASEVGLARARWPPNVSDQRRQAVTPRAGGATS